MTLVNVGKDRQKDDVLASTIHNPAFRKALEQALKAAHSNVFYPLHPPYAVYPPHHFWVSAIQHSHGMLGSQGFTIDKDGRQQLRLLSVGTYECPVRLYFRSGHVTDNGCAMLNTKIGVRTIEGVEQNKRHFKKQPLLSSDWLPQKTSVAREFNLWVIYKPEPRIMNAWLVYSTARLSPYRLRCEEAVVLYSGAMDSSTAISLPDKLPSNEGGFSITLGDRKTGTE